MSLRYAILVMLENRPTTGYEIAQEMAVDNGYIWQATHQQVYLEIKKLHKLEWITFTGQANEKSKTYEINDQGLRELQHWLDQPQAIPRTRDPLMVKLAAGYLSSHDQLKSEILEQQRFYQQRLVNLNRFSRYYSRYDQDFQVRFRLKYRALQLAIDQIQLWLDWSNQLLQELDY